MIRIVITALAFTILGAGCAMQELVVAEETELVVATSSIDEASLLDVVCNRIPNRDTGR